jgi:hypothetical protein
MSNPNDLSAPADQKVSSATSADLAQREALDFRIQKAHDRRNASQVDELIADAKRLGLRRPDVMRRLSDLLDVRKSEANQ